MKNNFEFITIAERQCFVFLPNNYVNGEQSYPVVYLHGDDSIYDLLKEAEYFSELSFIIIGIISEKRLDELTPWASPSLHPKFPGFGGKGNEYLDFIQNTLKPAVDNRYRTITSPESTGIMGYSLGGLISIYSAFRTDCFGCIASMSGSFWYPEFVPYATNQAVCNGDARIFMSSGDREGVGHKDIKKDAVMFTKNMYDILVAELGSDRVSILWDEGGHHSNTFHRYKNAFLWLNENLKK